MTTVQTDKDAIGVWDSLYRPIDHDTIWGDDPAEFVVREVAELWCQEGVDDILVLPSGDGRNIRPLLPRFPGMVCADTSGQALAQLRRAAALSNMPEPQTRICDVYEPERLGQQFDAILCWDLLSHLDRPRAAIAALLHCLRPGGSLVVNLYADDDPSIVDEHSSKTGPKRYRNAHGISYQLYNSAEARALAEGLPVSSAALHSLEWWEDPHPGYRDYRHMHRGHAMILRARS